MILAQNHSGGTAKPSNHDHQVTRHLAQTLGGIDIRVVDRVIVAGDQIYSFAREGVLPAYESRL